jgi:lipopolysaccharide export system protein LptA
METSGPNLFRVKANLSNGVSSGVKRCLPVGMALTLLGIWVIGRAQTLTIRPIKDFKVPDYYPNVTRGGTNQLRALLTGVEARPRPDGRVFVKEPRILHFNEAGQTQLVVRAIDCVYENKSKSASSTNTLRLQIGDGKFDLEGLGFHWNQTNSNLTISNKVRTLISRPLVESPSAKSPKPAGAYEQIEISSHDFKFISESKLAIWRGNVRVKDPRLTMNCDLVTAKLAGDQGKSEGQTGKLDSIIAESNVTIMVTESETYHLQMKSPDITMSLTNKTLKAHGPVRTKIPAGAFGKLSETGLSPKTSGPKPAGAQEDIEISCEDFEFISESKVAVWRGNVRAKDSRLTLACELLTATLAGESGKPESKDGKLESVVAETNVVLMITDSNSVTIAKGDKAVYSAESETLVLSGRNPMLESESSHLQMWSPAITMDLTNKTLKAKGPVRTKLPSRAFGKIGEVGSNSKPGDPKPAAVEESIEILAESFDFNTTARLAIWWGKVRAKDTKLDLSCELLTAKLAGESGELENIVAETNVVMRITETNGVTTVWGDQAVYSAANETLALSGKGARIDIQPENVKLRYPQFTMDLKNRTLNCKSPGGGTVALGAFPKIGEGDSRLKSGERKRAEPR